MRKKLLTLFMVLCLILSTMPVAFATNYADETAIDAQNYISVTKDESGKTTAFSLDFETGIDPIYEADLELFRPYKSDASSGYLYYIANYGADEGEWNGALNRAYLYATQDELDYKAVSKNGTTIYETVDDVTNLALGVDYFVTKPGQLIHNQWTENADSTVKLNPNGGETTPVFKGYGNYLGYTPNVVAGGKYFPEITAFSHAPAVQNGAAYSDFDEASEKAKYSNGSSLTTVNTKGDIANLSVVYDPIDSSNKVVKLSGSAPGSSPMADFSIIGKENVDLSNKVTKFEAKVYVAQDKTITDSTVATKNTKPFTMQIVKNNDFSGYPTSIKNNGLLYTTSTSPTRNIERILNGSDNDEYLDAVTFHAGKIYLGKSSDGVKVGEYTTGKWYTIRYYLDTTGAVPVNAVEIVDAYNNLVASKKADVTLNTYGTFGYLAGDDESRIASCQEKYSAFSGFDSESTYSVFLRNDTLGYDGVAYLDFVGYVDDISLAETTFMPSNISSREFTQTFENPAYHAELEWGTWKSTASNDTVRYYINNGDTAKASLASDSTFIFEGDFYNNQYGNDGTLNKPTSTLTANGATTTLSDFKSNGVKTENLRTGGLASYTGFGAFIHTMPSMWSSKIDDYAGQYAKVSNMFVQPLGASNVLYMNAQNGATGINWNWFGKEGMDIYGEKTKISFDLRNKFEVTSSNAGNTALVTLSITKDNGNMKDKIAAKTATHAQYNIRGMSFGASSAVTDAVTIYGGKAYIGNGVDANGNIDVNKFICDISDTEWYTVDAYLDYKTNVTNPKLTVVIKSADGSVKAMKEGLLPVSNESVATSVHGTAKNTGIVKDTLLFAGKGKNSKGTFTAEQADTDGYGVYVTVSANGSTQARKYIDNFTFTGYEDIDIPNASVNAILDEATKTLTANIVALSKVVGKLVAAEYNSETKALIQTAQTDVDTSVSFTSEAVFENALTPGATYKVFLWDGFTNITPLISSFAPKFVVAD